MIWLIVPVSLLAMASRLPRGGPLVALVGGALLALVLVHLPFLQARFAAEHRWAAMFEVMSLRRSFARAPLAFFVALVMTLSLAVPLYLLKIEIVPREARIAPVSEAAGQPLDQPDRLVGLRQQQRAGVRRHQAAVEIGHNLSTAGASKVHRPRATLCLHRGVSSNRRKVLLHNNFR